MVRWGTAAVLAGTFAILPGAAAGGDQSAITTAGQLTAEDPTIPLTPAPPNPPAPPSVHDMIVSLERRGLITRVPRQPRSIKLIVQPVDLPQLQSIDTSVARY